MTSARYHSLVARCDAVDHARWERATALATEAGIGVARNVWGNAMIALADGHGWTGVNYSTLREAIRVDASRDEITRLRERIGRRLIDAWRAYHDGAGARP